MLGNAHDKAQVGADHFVARFLVALCDFVGQFAFFFNCQKLELADFVQVEFDFRVVRSRRSFSRISLLPADTRFRNRLGNISASLKRAMQNRVSPLRMPKALLY